LLARSENLVLMREKTDLLGAKPQKAAEF
jgi:hypothetical protein